MFRPARRVISSSTMESTPPLTATKKRSCSSAPSARSARANSSIGSVFQASMQCAYQCFGFEHALVEFAFRMGTYGEGAPHRKPDTMRVRVVYQGSDHHVEVEISIGLKVPKIPRIGTSFEILQLFDKLHGADFRRARHRTGGKTGANGIQRAILPIEFGAHGRYHVVHRFEGVNAAEFIHLHRTPGGYARKVVAYQIHDHHILGNLLGVVAQLLPQSAVDIGVAIPANGSLDGLGNQLSVDVPQKALGRGAEDVAIGKAGKYRKGRCGALTQILEPRLGIENR